MTVVRRRSLAAGLLIATLMALVMGLGPSPASAHSDTSLQRCESHNWRTAYCGGALMLKDAVVQEQLSSTPCVKNVNFWVEPGGLLVATGGCRAIFTVSEDHHLKKVTCSSWGYRSRSCWTGVWIHQAEVMHQHSSSPCDHTSVSWSRDYLRVSSGCRATFVVLY
ncbi:MAG: DUF3011 domain-containing protein [Actinomycetota bacterium]